jgi:hypothetical protein
MSSDEDREPFPLTRRERAYLIDAVMVLMHQKEENRSRPRLAGLPVSDLSELPELQVLLERLMAAAPQRSPRPQVAR